MWSAADPEASVTVSVEMTLPDGPTVAGEKLQVAPEGSPEQANATVDDEENPFSGVSVTVSVPLLPAVTVMDGAESANAKSGEEVLPPVTVSTAVLL